MKYVIYLRISTKKQDLRTQLDHCLDLIRKNDKSDFVYEVYYDKITSKKGIYKDPESNEYYRPGVKQALQALCNGDYLVVMRLDRLSRKGWELSRIKVLLESYDIKIISVQQPGLNNMVVFAVYAGIAEEEVKTIRARINEKISSKRGRGERISRHLPYGYNKLDEKKLVQVSALDDQGRHQLKPGVLLEDEKEQENLTLMMKLFDEGYSYANISKALAEKGIYSRAGKPFHKSTIHKILLRTGRSRSEEAKHQESAVHWNH